MRVCKKMTNVYTRLLQLPGMHYILERSLYIVSLLYVYKLHTVYKITVRNALHPKNRLMC